VTYPGGEISRFTNDLSSYAGISLTADRGGLVTAQSTALVGIWVGDGMATPGAETVPLHRGGGAVAWAGDRLLYTTNTGGQPSIMGLVPGRGMPELIISRGAFPAATSDGGTIVFLSTEAGARAGLWKTDADGRNAMQLVTGQASSPIVTPDDRQVLFLSQRGGQQSLWMVPIDGGTPIQVVNEFVSSGVDVSPNGQSLLFSSVEQNRQTLVVSDLPACATRRNVTSPNVGFFRWMPNGRDIAYVDATASNVWVLSPDGKPARQLTHFSDNRRIQNVAWSHDGKRLAIARGTSTDDIVLFTGLKK
jgi:Tol biopolymer transport system component